MKRRKIRLKYASLYSNLLPNPTPQMIFATALRSRPCAETTILIIYLSTISIPYLSNAATFEKDSAKFPKIYSV